MDLKIFGHWCLIVPTNIPKMSLKKSCPITSPPPNTWVKIVQLGDRSCPTIYVFDVQNMHVCCFFPNRKFIRAIIKFTTNHTSYLLVSFSFGISILWMIPVSWFITILLISHVGTKKSCQKANVSSRDGTNINCCFYHLYYCCYYLDYYLARSHDLVWHICGFQQLDFKMHIHMEADKTSGQIIAQDTLLGEGTSKHGFPMGWLPSLDSLMHSTWVDAAWRVKLWKCSEKAAREIQGLVCGSG